MNHMKYSKLILGYLTGIDRFAFAASCNSNTVTQFNPVRNMVAIINTVVDI